MELSWQKLLNGKRRKDKFSGANPYSIAAGRVELERDYDRILFATPTRRMADKTQVFPLERNDSVRNRLTHSHEVSNLARSIGNRLVFEFREQVFKGVSDDLQIERCVPSLLAAIGLAHDLGNPPFGHQGEVAMQEWFQRNNASHFNNQLGQDFLKFDGNAQTFRLVTKLQVLNDNYGLNLTYATLASMLKYPVAPQTVSSSEHWKKHGFFNSELTIVEDIWQETGLSEHYRHPFTYIMEACDDIAYSVLDAEDIVKKGLASFSDIVDFLEHQNGDDAMTCSVLQLAKQKNMEFKQQSLSPRELNDVSMQIFRVYAVGHAISAIVDQFVADCDAIMAGDLGPGYQLIEASTANHFCSNLKQFDYQHGYRHKSVLELELKGNNYITGIMDMLWLGIHGHINNKRSKPNSAQFSHAAKSPFGRYAYERISENYRRIFEDPTNTMPIEYKEAQLLADAVSGMTDTYLITIHDELKALLK
ncbi:dGTP triphosphohydrolase [Flocculibacter collagenilyticus]|uniref:dGTP triphosphohydrolase n=1 Tax=Flocculibacter collagenilyticus TaxID=2744479 RepID=UPI0018F4CCC2|nr:dNTP triphosphohydrolase [Flocculibacter collagenilyticus]